MSLLVHVGAPKTATSTLQSGFFPHHPDLYFLGKIVDGERGHTGWRNPAWTELMLGLERSNADYDPDPSQVADMVAAAKAEAGGRLITLSSEDLCTFTGTGQMAKLDRLAALFGDQGGIKIVLGVREQTELLKSIYLTEHRGEMLKIAGTEQSWYPTFDQYLDIHFRYAWRSVLDSFRFAALIEQYGCRVGPENVFVYAFSDFKRDPASVFRRICLFAGVSADPAFLSKAAETHENAHSSTRGYLYSRLRAKLPGVTLSTVLPRSLIAAFRRWVAAGKPMAFEPSAQATARIRQYYRADNEELARKFGIIL